MIESMKSAARRFRRTVDPFKGQKGQDKWVVFNALPFKRGGFFLDLAAADGVTHSNTYVLEKLFGWDGICIEPNPNSLRKLRKYRKCTIDDSVISDKNEKVKFRIDNGQLAGIVDTDTDNNYRTRGDELSNSEIVTLDAALLVDVLDRYHAPKIIDYLSLDVEGSEERIVRSFDFGKFQFCCLTIERPTPKVNDILFSNGYIFVKNHGYDSFYVHSSLAQKRNIRCNPFEQVPAKDW